MRASEPAEVDYTSDSGLSLAMTDILHFIFGNIRNAAGEAALEMLVALACGKLRLQRKHIDTLLPFDGADVPPLGRALFRYIRENPDQPLV